MSLRLLLLIWLASGSASPAPPVGPASAPPARKAAGPEVRSAHELIERVRAANGAIRSWTADFLQRRHFVHFNETEERTGRIRYRRGMGLRVDIEAPGAETIVVTSEKALQWQPKTRQLHVYKLLRNAASPTPLPFAFGDKGWDPEADHDARLLGVTETEYTLELVARGDNPTYTRKVLSIDRSSWLPVRIQLTEATDDVVTFAFSRVALDLPLDDAQFRLQVPDDADVVEHDTLPSF